MLCCKHARSCIQVRWRCLLSCTCDRFPPPLTAAALPCVAPQHCSHVRVPNYEHLDLMWAADATEKVRAPTPCHTPLPLFGCPVLVVHCLACVADLLIFAFLLIDGWMAVVLIVVAAAIAVLAGAVLAGASGAAACARCPRPPHRCISEHMWTAACAQLQRARGDAGQARKRRRPSQQRTQGRSQASAQPRQQRACCAAVAVYAEDEEERGRE